MEADYMNDLRDLLRAEGLEIAETACLGGNIYGATVQLGERVIYVAQHVDGVMFVAWAETIDGHAIGDGATGAHATAIRAYCECEVFSRLDPTYGPTFFSADEIEEANRLT